MLSMRLSDVRGDDVVGEGRYVVVVVVVMVVEAVIIRWRQKVKQVMEEVGDQKFCNVSFYVNE